MNGKLINAAVSNVETGKEDGPTNGIGAAASSTVSLFAVSKAKSAEDDAIDTSDPPKVLQSKIRDAEDDELEPEQRGCCVRNLDNCYGDNVRATRDCGYCLFQQGPKELHDGVRQLEYKRWAKEICTVDNIKRKFPISLWLPKYRLNYILGDLIAGLTVGLTALPQGLAYAQIALLEPQYGLYSCFMPVFVYCIFGTAKDMSIGPTAVMSLLVGQFAASPIPGDASYAIFLAMMTGIIQFAMGVFRLGFLVKYISHSVVHAFTMASVVTITFSQIPNWLGLKGIPRDFISQVHAIFTNLYKTRVQDCVLGLVCMIILFLMKKMKTTTCLTSKNKSKFIKFIRYVLWLISTGRNAVVVMMAAGLAAIMINYWNKLQPFTLTGHIPSGLPTFKLPAFSVSNGNGTTYHTSDMFNTIGAGFAIIPLIGLVETVAIGKIFGRINKYTIEPNQELLATGLGNFLGSLVSGYPVTGSFSRTSVNCQSGVRTTAAGLVTGTLVMLAIRFLTPYFYYIPSATLSAIIIMAVTDMFDLTLLIEMWNVKKLDLLPWFVTFLCCLLISVDYGLIIGIVVSLCIILYPAALPKLKDISDFVGLTETQKETIKVDYKVLQLSQGLTFPSEEDVVEHVLKGMMSGEQSACRSVILDFTHITTVDFTVVKGIQQLSNDFANAGVLLVVCQLRPQVSNVLLKAKIKDLKLATTVSQAICEIHDVHLMKDTYGTQLKTVSESIQYRNDDKDDDDDDDDAGDRNPYRWSGPTNVDTQM